MQAPWPIRAYPMQAEPIKNTLDIRREIRRCQACARRFSRDAVFCPYDGTKLEATAFEPLVDPIVGSTVDGRYEVVEVLGEGGMGRVYRVRHVALERSFAMKVLRRDLARDEDLGARFIHEAKATASVKHPNVVQINDFGRFPDGIPYFVMELLIGHTLGEIIKAGGPIPAGRAVRIVKQVAGALGAAHAAGVVHRDLKPDNVFLVGGSVSEPSEVGRARAMLSETADVRVVDFGASKIIGSSRLTRTGIVFGTPHYMSPEQASGVPVDHRSDIYALGIIMYEMFTGRVPFEADTYMGVLTQHMFVQPVPPSQVSDAAKELGALEQITLICLEKRPEDRFGSMQDLVDALDRVVRVGDGGVVDIASVLDTHPSRAQASVRYRMADELEPPTLEEMRVAIGSEPPSRQKLRWGWIALGGGTVVAGLAVFALVFEVPRGEPPRPASSTATVAVIAPAPLEPLPSSTSPSVSPSTSDSPVNLPAPGVAPTPHPSTHRPAPPRSAPTRIDDVGDPFTSRR
jgi:serine/threonine-protein kinase